MSRSSSTNRFNPPPRLSAGPPPVPRNWRPLGAHAPPPYDSEPSGAHPSPDLNPHFPRPGFQLAPQTNAQGQRFPEPGLPIGPRTFSGPLELPRFPDLALGPIGFLLFEMIRAPPIPTPGYMRFQALPGPQPQYGDESRLSQEEQKQALKMLKKGIYNPTANAKSLAKRLSLFYKGGGGGRNSNLTEDEDGKRCAVCLDDFEPKEEVMLTPCNHMFHEDCIVPWVKSHAQCPVCRFAIYQPTRALNTNNAQLPPSATDERELMSVIGDLELEDAFVWGTPRDSQVTFLA